MWSPTPAQPHPSAPGFLVLLPQRRQETADENYYYNHFIAIIICNKSTGQ